MPSLALTTSRFRIPNSVKVTPALLKKLNVTPEEYERIVKLMGRAPTLTELGIFSVMHSEHCSYASSKIYLKTFPTKGKHVLVPAGEENAGVIDIGNGVGVAFKVESHNHPSAVEPHAGAATGVGGILRDIFTMGARPIALFDSLRFGPLSATGRTRFLFEGVVRGIADYGNCLAPTELVTIRNSGKVKTTPIGPYIDTLVNSGTSSVEHIPSSRIEVLSLDPLTNQPRWCRVVRVWRRRAPHLMRIKTTMGRSWLLTPDHPAIVLENDRLVKRSARLLKCGDKLPVLARLPEESIPSHLDLIELFCNSHAHIYVRLRRSIRVDRGTIQAALRSIEPSASNRHRYLKRSRMPLQLYLDLEKRFGFDRRNIELFLPSGKSNYIGCEISLDQDFARLIGYYLAEGCVSQNGTTYKIIWTFGRHATDRWYVSDVCRILRRLGWRFSVQERISTVAIAVSSWFIGVLLKDIWKCGDKAHTKSIPDLFFRARRPFRVELLKGLWRGDGSVSIRKSGSRVKVALGTASQTLAHQVALLLQDLGVIPLCYVGSQKTSRLRGRLVKRRPLHHLELNGYRAVKIVQTWFAPVINRRIHNALKAYRFQDLRWSFPRYKVRGPLAFLPIRETTLEPYTGSVYDFEVERSRLFVTTGGLVTHNCIGVPTVGGEIYFDETYRENPLVNVMCVGIVPAGRIAMAKAKGTGNTVMYVGSSTGRDGLGGASFASREITDGSEADRPAVQIGDPFAEKCLLEATLEVLATDDVIAIQDMGAAGLTCSTCETASRGRCGIEIDVAKVPRRETGMTPFEVMLSESQERMLLVVKRGREERVKRRFAKWGLHAVEIGHVTNDSLMRVKDHGAVVAEIPVGALTHDAPVYRRPTKRPTYLSRVQRLSLRAIPQPRDYGQTLLKLLGSPTIASKAHVFEQYDHMVQTNTVVLPGRADAAVLRLKGTDALLAATTDANATFCYLNPYEGGQLAVAEAARNLVCVGAKPLAITDCLNFGNPEDPEIMWQFKECVRGIAEACRVFATPVTGGNVSFYNESPHGAIDPTPVIGMIGLIEVGSRKSEVGSQTTSPFALPPSHFPLTAGFKDEGDMIILFGQTREELGGSEYLKIIHHRKRGRPPKCNLAHERRLGQLMLELCRRGLLKSAHDCSEGGLAVTLAECCIMDPDHLIGATIQFGSRKSEVGSQTTSPFGLPPSSFRVDAWLFGESAGRIVVSCERYHQELIEALARRFRVPMTVLGRVGGSRLRIASWLDGSASELNETYRTALPRHLHR